jgi:hypothetical protein
MFRRLYFSSRYGSYLGSEHGVKKFAEMCMGQLIRKVTKKSAFYREHNENMLVEKANLRMRQDELNEQALLSPGAFFSVRRRVMANTMLFVAVLATSLFMYHISVIAFVGPEAGITDTMRWMVAGLLALVVTGGGTLVTERLIESVLPSRAEDEIASMQRNAMGVLWGILLIGILLSILGITTVRGTLLAEGAGSALLLYGFLTLALLLPIIAGTVRWDAMQHVDAYKTTRAHRQIDGRLAQIDSVLRQNEEFESNFYKLKSIAYWDLLNEFKTYKDVYNERHDIVESLAGHFSQNYDSFQAEANKRYESDIRDITTKSLRKLESGEKMAAGAKLGQSTSIRMQPVRESGPMYDGGERQESDIYLSPKPIR